MCGNCSMFIFDKVLLQKKEKRKLEKEQFNKILKQKMEESKKN